MYIMTPYAATPSFYEVALDDCLTDTNEFFKNHKDVGPFAAIARSGPLADDLTAFLSKWQPNAMETYVDLGSTPSGEFELSTDKDASREISVLAAAQNVKQLLASGQTAQAAALGVKYHIVTPVSGAVVLENASDYRRFGMEVPNGTPEQSQVGIASAPMLQGATNGTLGPQGSDATMISGINTTGTVRVNNLANLEALINICANGLELVGMIWGGISLVMGAMGKGMISPFKLSAKGRMAFGVTIVLLGLAAPGMFNWLLASARDANLFS
jgi:hypothetical protein